MAPECGPWAGWNRLNLFKSPESIQQKQFEQLPHVRLCSRICQYQVPLKQHVHLEQPIGSNMILPARVLADFQGDPSCCARYVSVWPAYAQFKECHTEEQPVPLKFFQTLNNHKCKGQHEHQRTEGSLNIQGKFRRVSQFCAAYEGLLIKLPD